MGTDTMASFPGENCQEKSWDFAPSWARLKFSESECFLRGVRWEEGGGRRGLDASSDWGVTPDVELALRRVSKSLTIEDICSRDAVVSKFKNGIY